MINVVWVIGALFVLEGVVFLVKPQICRKVLEFFVQDKLLYVPGAVRVFFGVIFLIYGRSCSIPAIIIVFGIVLLVLGVAGFTIGLERQKAIVNWGQQKSATVLRLMAIVVILLGAIVVYSA